MRTCLTPIFALMLSAVAACVAASVESSSVAIGIDAPLADASVCAGSDGVYYLTGTTALPGAGGQTDFHNNRGVRVWASKDLRAWEDKGFVWDLWKDPSNNAHGASGSAWQTELYPVPGLPPGERARGMMAPRLNFDGQRFWITFSMNGYAAGAMPAQGADVAGPYQDARLIAEAGAAPTDKSDASLFVDADGARYLVWGGGCVAKLKPPEALAKLIANETGVEGPVRYLPALIEGFPGDDGLPEHGAPYGVSLWRNGGRYHFVFSATTLRDGGLHEDAYVATAPALFGPYAKPRRLVADGGRVTIFNGPDGAPRVSYSTPSAQPRIAPFAPEAVPTPATSDAPKSGRGEIVTSVPRLPESQKPGDVPQLLEMIEPLFDHPLRDGAICRGPDGTWYLTGTEATRAADGTMDWSNNSGVHLWSSKDRKNWNDLGYVWDIDRDAPASPRSAWQRGAHLDVTCGAAPRIGRAVTAPEIHYLKGTFWIAYSMNGSGIGLLKSRTGKAEGPYEDLGRLVASGRDPSLFEDADGSVHLVWGQGFCARMKDDMTGLAAAPVKTLFTGVNWFPRYLRRPENMGLWGSHLVKTGDWYVWTFTTRTGRLGINSIDTMASWSKSLDGPWAEPCLMLANGGQSTLVSDGEGGWLATVSGEDEYSQWPYRAAITPVVTNGGARGKGLTLQPLGAKASTTDFAAVNSLKATALDLWVGHPDLIPCTIRDVCLIRDTDGAYYCTGSFWGVEQYKRDVIMFRSMDLLHWSPLPPVYSYFKLKDDGLIDDAKAFDELVQADREGKNWRMRIQIGEQKIWPLGGAYYMNAQAFCQPGGHFLLKSTTGKIAGPYKGVSRIVGVADLMQDDDGAILFNMGGTLRRFGSVAEFERATQEDFRKNVIAIQNPGLQNICFSEDCEAGIMRIEGKYVNWSTDWTGSYDINYQFADDWRGPWKGRARLLPYGGNGRFFQNEKGTWFYAYFPNSNDYASRDQNRCRLNIYPLWIGMENDEFIIEPVALRANRAALEKMGALWQSPQGKAK